MNAVVRVVVAIAIVTGVAAFVRTMSSDSGAANGSTEPPRFTSSKQCAECHREVFDEWQGSHHQIAYENPEVRKLSDDFRNKECQACHLPRPISQTGLLNRTLPRVTRPDEGVDCLACHLDVNGRVVGLNASDLGCAPVADAEHMGVNLCGTCHNQHETTDQWRASRYAKEGITCNDCHMPKVTRADGSTGRRHVYEGCHDEEMLRSAATFEATREGDELVLAVTNTGAGHNFPTEERHRAVDILVRFVDEAGTATDWQHLYRFRQPYRDEPQINTQLPADARHESRVDVPADAVRAEARLWYRLNPYATDDDPASTLLFEREVDLR
ncbi:MAG: multiheme c-type cytochrome [Planctomycetota bacterium JB042]